jgi:hypothetical protein
MADLDEIMSGSGADSVVDIPTQPPEPRTDGRDEHGRFASQQPPEAPQPEQPPVPETPAQEQRPPDGFIPIQALDARLAKERERADAALRQQAEQFQRQLAAFQQPQKPAERAKQPEFFENPDAAVDFRLKGAIEPLQQGQQQIVENFSRMMASDKFGEDTVQAALAEMTNRVQANPQGMRFDYQRIMSSPHPYGELVKWHKAQTALSEIGDDPKAFREKLRAELLAEIQGGQQPQTPGAQPPPVLPTSFSGARNAGSNSTPQWSGPRPLSEIMPR